MVRPVGRIPNQKFRAVFWPRDGSTDRDDPVWMGFGYCPALHKSRSDLRPHCVPNELIAGKLGIALGLPIPAFGISHMERSNRPYFSSLDFNYVAGKTRSSQLTTERPPIIASACVRNLSYLCTGVTLFDVLIANEERNTLHVVADDPKDPTWIVAFDHDMSLFGGDPPTRPCGIDRLKELRDELGINTRFNRHCFIDELNDPDDLTTWVKRISSVPDFLLRDVCNEATRVGLTEAEAGEAYSFLAHRKKTLGIIIKDNLKEFPQVTSWTPPNFLF